MAPFETESFAQERKPLHCSQKERCHFVQIQLSDVYQRVHKVTYFENLTIRQEIITLQISTIQISNGHVSKLFDGLKSGNVFSGWIDLGGKVDSLAKYFSHQMIQQRYSTQMKCIKDNNSSQNQIQKLTQFSNLSKRMQQQVTSYTYQLSQNLQVLITIKKKSILECHVTQPLLYVGARVQNRTNKPNKSFLYRLHFDQQNPRKSEVKKQEINGTIEGVYSIVKDSEDLLLIVRDDEGKYSLSKAAYPLLENQLLKLQTLQSFDTTKYSVISHKQTKKHFLVGQRDIYGMNEETMARGQKLIEIEQGKSITSSVLDPIHELLTYVIDGHEIIVTDKTFKKQKYALRLPSSDNSPIQSIDYNPNKQYYLMSCHNQAIKFWDIRKQNLPVKVYNDHHAIVLNAKYNHSHDELICCSYDDGTIGLLRMNSVSSTPGQNDDTLVKLYDEHEDSVFSVKWTSFSPWIFASLSYSAANIVVNFVPSVQKYRILL